MSSIRHPNVVLFMGLCFEPPCMVSEFCARGSLYDVLKRARAKPALGQQLDWPKRLNMLLDAAKVGCCLNCKCSVHAGVQTKLSDWLMCVNMLLDTGKGCFIVAEQGAAMADSHPD